MKRKRDVNSKVSEYRSRLVRAFLAAKRELEPTLAASVRVWIGRDEVGWYGHPQFPVVNPPLRRAPTGRPKATGPRQKKQSLYFHQEVLAEIFAEADRRSVPPAKVIQSAWELAREEIRKFPGAGL